MTIFSFSFHVWMWGGRDTSSWLAGIFRRMLFIGNGPLGGPDRVLFEEGILKVFREDMKF